MPATAAAQATSRYDIDGFLKADRGRAGHDRHAAGAAALARLLLVLAGPEQAAAREIGRYRRDPAQRGGRDCRCGRLRQAAHSADPARRRDRQLRAGRAAGRRRAARPHRHDQDRVAEARPGALRARHQDERSRCRDPAERLGNPHASLDQAHGDDRRLRRRRLGRHRLDQLRRPARARQHPVRARGHAARKRRA